MSTEIAVALITLAESAFGTLAGILLNTKLTSYRIEHLEKKAEKHNNLIDRVYRLEEHDAVFEEEIKVVNHRISDLKQAERS